MKMEWWHPPGIGIIFVIVFLQRLRLKSERTPVERFRDLCMIAAFGALISASEFLPWQGMMKVLAAIQFPWRLYLPATAFAALGGGLLLGALLAGRSNAARRTWLWILFCGCLFPWGFLHCYEYAAKISEHEVYRNISREHAARAIMSGVHFLPQGRVDGDYAGLGGKTPVRSDDPDSEATAEVVASGWNRLEIKFSGFKPDDAFEIPRVYYKGYQVETEKGGCIDVVDQEHFLFRPNASEGVAVVRYRMTTLHLVAFFVSSLAFDFIILLLLLRRIRARRAKEAVS